MRLFFDNDWLIFFNRSPTIDVSYGSRQSYAVKADFPR